MSLAKTYTPNEYEPSIYALWEESGVFKPKGQGQPYAIVMPPPNANGNLHVGHALGSAIQDILVRITVCKVMMLYIYRGLTMLALKLG